MRPAFHVIDNLSNLYQDVGDVGLVEGRERKVLLAEVVQGSAYMNESYLVDDEEEVKKLIGHLDRKRVAALRVEPRHIDSVKQLASV